MNLESALFVMLLPIISFRGHLPSRLEQSTSLLFLCGIQAAFITLDIDMADELIRKRERSLKGAARAKLSRTKEFDHSKWVGGGMLDYRFSNARRIVNDIYAGEVSADV